MKKKLTDLMHWNRHVRRPLKRIGMLMAMVSLMLMGVLTVLTADRDTGRKEGGLQSLLMGTDIIYKGGMVGITPAGLAMAMGATAGYTMGGVAYEKIDDSAAAGTKRVRAYTSGVFLLAATSISQAMVGQPMYAVDDQTFDDEPGAEAIFVGILAEYVSATSGWLDIGPACMGERVTRRIPWLLKTDNYTVLEEESGSIFAIATDAKVFTLPATKKGLVYTFINTGAAGAVLLTISPDAADKIQGNLASSVGKNADATTADGLVDICAGNDDGDLTNTKNTANPGDRVTLVGDGLDGWWIVEGVGIWAGA